MTAGHDELTALILVLNYAAAVITVRDSATFPHFSNELLAIRVGVLWGRMGFSRTSLWPVAIGASFPYSC